MNRNEVIQAVNNGQLVTLGDDPTQYLMPDMFGQLTVVSMQADVPARLATRSDMRKAVIRDNELH